MSAPQIVVSPEVSLQRIEAVAGADRAFVGEMIQEFRSDTARAASKLANGVANADREGVRKALHSLRGLSATVEASALSELTRKAEQLLVADDFASLAPLVAEINVAIEAANSGLEQLFRAGTDA